MKKRQMQRLQQRMLQTGLLRNEGQLQRLLQRLPKQEMKLQRLLRHGMRYGLFC